MANDYNILDQPEGAGLDHGSLTGLTDDDHTIYVQESVLDANTILYATTDNTPAALAVAASRIVGRKASGDTAALTAAETKTVLGITEGDITLPMEPTGALAVTSSRRTRHDNSAVLATGRLHLVGIPLTAGQTVTTITFVSGTTAAVNPSNQVCALYSYHATAPVLLGVTDDKTTAAWGANTAKTFTMAVAYPVVTSGFYYLGIWVVADTPPSLIAMTANAALTGLAPILTGTSTTGLTNPASAPNPAATPTAATVIPYAYVS